LKVLQKRIRDPFVDEHTAVLGIISEFHNIEISVVSLYQVCLCPPTHLANKPHSVNRHEGGSNLSQEERTMPEETQSPAGPTRSKDEVALELMKFIAVTTGYGKGSGGAGYGIKAAKSAEDHADSLIELFERCRSVVNG